MALALPALASAAPLRFPVLVASTQPVFNLPDGVAGWTARTEFFIDTMRIAQLAPGAMLGMRSLGLDEGTHQFHFSISLRQDASGLELEEDCVGQFEVHGTMTLQPTLQLRASRAAPGKLADRVDCGVAGPAP